MATRRRDRGADYGGVPDRVARLLLEEAPADGVETVWRLFQHGSRLEALWREFGPVVLPLWVRRHPGTRPAAWWRVEASEPRRRLDGRPARWRGPRGTHGAGEYESEATHLRRLGLLLKGEAARIPAVAWEPETIG